MSNHYHPKRITANSSPLLGVLFGLRVKMCVWLGVSRGLDLAFLNAD